MVSLCPHSNLYNFAGGQTRAGKKHQAEVRNLGCGCSPVQARYCI